MRFAFQLVAFAIFLWTFALVWRVHSALLRHMREWTVFTHEVLNQLPPDDAQVWLVHGSNLMVRQVEELRAIRAWPFPIRLSKPAP